MDLVGWLFRSTRRAFHGREARGSMPVQLAREWASVVANVSADTVYTLMQLSIGRELSEQSIRREITYSNAFAALTGMSSASIPEDLRKHLLDSFMAGFAEHGMDMTELAERSGEYEDAIAALLEQIDRGALTVGYAAGKVCSR